MIIYMVVCVILLLLVIIIINIVTKAGVEASTAKLAELDAEDKQLQQETGT